MVEMCKTSDSEDRLKHAKLMLEGLGTGGGGIDAMPWFLVSISVPQMEEAPLHHTPHHHHHHHHHLGAAAPHHQTPLSSPFYAQNAMMMSSWRAYDRTSFQRPSPYGTPA